MPRRAIPNNTIRPMRTLPRAPIAAIDIGTNSAHLVIAEMTLNGHLHLLDSEKITLRLGSHIDAKGNISTEAIQRTAGAVKHMCDIARAYTDQIRAVATYATREAANHEVLLKAIKQRAGVDVEIIDGFEEARLEFLGIQQGLPLSQNRVLAVDIGGGSTEIIVGKGSSIEKVSSLKLGAVILTKRFGDQNKISKAQLKKMESFIDNRLGPIMTVGKRVKFTKAVASSGTAKTLAYICSREFDNKEINDANGYVFTCSQLKKIYKRLCKLATPAKIRAEFGIEPNRAEIILAGTATLVAISKIFKVKSWHISTYSLREGLVVDTYERLHGKVEFNNDDVRWRNILSFGRKFNIEEAHSRHVAALSLQAYEALENRFLPKIDAFTRHANRELLNASAYLHEVGKTVAFSGYHRHSEYILSRANIMGFTENEKSLIGLIVRYHRKVILTRDKAHKDSLLAKNFRRIAVLSACLRIATSLDRTRRQRIRSVGFRFRGKSATLTCRYTGPKPPETELYKLSIELPLIDQMLETKLRLECKA